jgi:high-affinity Fe2+/Pb2+ permease
MSIAARLRHWWQGGAPIWQQDANSGAQLLEAACELERLQAVAEAAETVMVNIGMLGEIATDHDAVSALMNALHEWRPL